MKRLFLDDVRDPTPGMAQWDVVRNYDQFVQWVEQHGCPDVVSFDHDLAPEHYTSYGTTLEPTGLDCARYLLDRELIPKSVIVHSWNPDGALAIAKAFAGHCEVIVLAYGVPIHLARRF